MDAVDDDDVLFDFFWARDIKEEKDPDGRDVTLIRHRRRARAHPSVPICDDATRRWIQASRSRVRVGCVVANLGETISR